MTEARQGYDGGITFDAAPSGPSMVAETGDSPPSVARGGVTLMTVAKNPIAFEKSQNFFRPKGLS